MTDGVVSLWVAIIGLILAQGLAFAKYRMDLRNMALDDEKRKKERDEELETMAKRVCREFLNDPVVQAARDIRIKEVSQFVIDDAFRTRAGSFVDKGMYDADNRALDRRLTTVENAIRENTKELGNVGGQIVSAVTTQLTAFLSSRVVVGKSD